MKKKYLYLFVFAGLLTACSEGGETPEPPKPEPDPNENVKPDEGEGEKPQPDVAKTYTFPTDFSDELIGKEVEIKNDLYVVRTYGSKMNEDLTLATSILRTPTDSVLPGTAEYKKLAQYNQENMLLFRASASTGSSLLDPSEKTLRVGSKFSGLKGKVSKERGRYLLTATADPKVLHSKRPQFDAHTSDVSVVSMNLEFYMASPDRWGHSNGAKTEEEFQRQSQKIVLAMKEMSADIYAVCEIEEGNYSPKYLADALNKELQTTRYKYVDSGDEKVTSNTKNTFIYNSEVVTPYKDCKIYDDSYLKLRHINQCFNLKGKEERFILSVNHFKAKVGKNPSGMDQDQHDGQGLYNSRRVREAQNCLRTYEDLSTYYGDPDVLVVGDLNSYSKEDPIRVFTDAGYTDVLMKYAPQGWSYVYDGQVGYLDHIISSPTMTSQVVHATAWDVNSSEPVGLGYRYPEFFQADAYRYSDHSPVAVFLDLK